MNGNKKAVIAIVIGVVAIFFVSMMGLLGMAISKTDKTIKAKEAELAQYEAPESGDTLESLMKRVTYTELEPVKAPINDSEFSMYDEMPEIDRYPLAVEGYGDVDIEIFSSGEKASLEPVTDSWLIKVADSFNASGATTTDGRSISMSVRSVPSGTAADYIISGKYLPDMYTPSNELFGNYAIAMGGKLELHTARTVGNTAGVLVETDSKLVDLNGVLDTVMSGNFNLGYTNPQSSATGLNLLVQLLKDFGKGKVNSDEAAEAFSRFNNNIPYIAYTTQQMRNSASRGGLDGMVSEYQAYINDETLKTRYKFIPFGMRHDNPIYVVDKSHKSASELEAIEQVVGYMLSAEMQKTATEYGYNANDDYASSYECVASDVLDAFEVYKKSKDSGKKIYAIFVADRSGSMGGEAISQLKSSISNGMNYINESNSVGLLSYGTDITLEVPIKPFDLSQKAYFQGALNRMSSGGGTSTYEALCVAVDLLNQASANDPDCKKMIFLLSDGNASGSYTLKRVEYMISQSAIPVYTIGYTDTADKDELAALSAINEAESISADTDDVIYKIRSLFNAQL